MRTYNRIIVFAVVILTVFMVVRLGLTGERYTGPLIDAHGHLGASFDWDIIVQVMDRTNVSRQIVMPRYYRGPAGSADLPGSDELALELADKYPGRFVPLVGMHRQSPPYPPLKNPSIATCKDNRRPDFFPPNMQV